MALITETPTNTTIYRNAGTVAPGLASAFRPAVNGYVGTVEDKAQLAQAYVEGLGGAIGYGAISGGTIAAGVGLNVTITASTAIVGNLSRTDTPGTVGLTDSATNYIYRMQNGTYQANTAGTIPGTASGGTALLWGRAVCAGGTVSSVVNDRLFFYPSSGEHQTQLFTASGTVTDRRIALGSAASGSIIISLPAPVVPQLPITVKQIAAGGTVHINVGGGGSIDGAGTVSLTTQYTFRQMAADGTAWWVIGS